MHGNIVSWNPCTRSQLISYSQRKLQLLEFGEEKKLSRELNSLKSWDTQHILSLDWRPCVEDPVVAYGTSSGSVHLLNVSSGDEISVSQGFRLGKRCCNAVAWNKHMPSQLLAGFDSLKSEFCAIVWDFEHEHFLQASFGEPACSLSWLPDNAHSLAVGTNMGWVKVYDTRTNSQVSAACSIQAHPAPRPRKVRGIRADPFRPHLFATYSDFPGDVVKIWDLRKVANPTSKAAIPPAFVVVPSTGSANGGNHTNNNSGKFSNGSGTGDAEAVVDVAWSTARPGILAVATSTRQVVSFYSTSTVSGTSRVPVYCVDVPGRVQVNGFSWQSGPVGGLFAVTDGAGGEEAVHFNPSNNSPLQGDRKAIVASMNSAAAGRNQNNGNPAPAPAPAPGIAQPYWESFRCEEDLRNIGHSLILRDNMSLSGSASSVHNSSSGAVSSSPRLTLSYPRLLVATTVVADEATSSSDAVAFGDGFAELEVLDRMPLSLSTAGGLLAVNTMRGRQVAISAHSVNRIPCHQFDRSNTANSIAATAAGAGAGGDSESPALAYCCTDTGEIMRHRCTSGYSADAYTNLDVLAEELDAVYTLGKALSAQEFSFLAPAIANTKAVYRTWAWMDRFESTVTEAGLTVSNCGILEVLLRNQLQNSATNLRQASANRAGRHPLLGALVFSSEGRTLSKKLCGWIKMFGMAKSAPLDGPGGSLSRTSSANVGGKQSASAAASANANVSDAGKAGENDVGADTEEDLLDVIVDELFLDSFERAAAIALWHGRIDMAVNVLRRAIAQLEDLRPPRQSVPANGREESKTRTRSGGDLMAEGNTAHQSSSTGKIQWDAPYGPGYLQTLSLVAMCLAGYHYAPTASSSSSTQDVRASSPGTNKSSQQQQLPPACSSTTAVAAAAATWASMCKHVLLQLELSQRDATAYLTAACKFLLANVGHSEDGEFGKDQDDLTPAAMYRSVLSDSRLTLEDRVAFACTYLGDEEVVTWLENTAEERTSVGAIEAVLITGLSDAGLGVLQAYIDRFEDVQTVALLVSRVIDSPQARGGGDGTSASGAGGGGGGGGSNGGGGGSGQASTPTREWIWLHEYRNLLNKWEMFIERAYLDVELGKRYRRKAAMIAQSAANNSAKDRSGNQQQGMGAKRGGSKGMSGQQGGTQSQVAGKSKAGRVLYRLPVHSDYPHFYLRCGFCGAALPVDGMQNVRPEQLRTQNNVLNCCAACSKQLPRCYVCQLYMGMVNPYLELNRVMTQKRLSADKLLHLHRGVIDDTAAGAGKDLEHNAVAFGKWFFFCQHCRHGGHANCIDQWFGGSGNVCIEVSRKQVDKDKGNSEEVRRLVCGVNGCECKCVTRL